MTTIVMKLVIWGEHNLSILKTQVENEKNSDDKTFKSTLNVFGIY